MKKRERSHERPPPLSGVPAFPPPWERRFGFLASSPGRRQCPGLVLPNAKGASGEASQWARRGVGWGPVGARPVPSRGKTVSCRGRSRPLFRLPRSARLGHTGGRPAASLRSLLDAAASRSVTRLVAPTVTPAVAPAVRGSLAPAARPFRGARASILAARYMLGRGPEKSRSPATTREYAHRIFLRDRGYKRLQTPCNAQTLNPTFRLLIYCSLD